MTPAIHARRLVLEDPDGADVRRLLVLALRDCVSLGTALAADATTSLREPIARTRDQLAAAWLVEQRGERWRHTPEGTRELELIPPIPDVGRHGFDSTGSSGGASYGAG